MQRLGFKNELIGGSKGNVVDSLIHRRGANAAVDTFWLVGAHGDQRLDDLMQKKVDSVFVRLQHTAVIEAWAQLYARKK